MFGVCWPGRHTLRRPARAPRLRPRPLSSLQESLLMRSPLRRLATLALSAALFTGFALAQQATQVGTLEGHTEPVYAVAWSPDGQMLVTASFDNTVRLWDAATRKELHKFDGHESLVLAAAFRPDGQQV